MRSPWPRQPNLFCLTAAMNLNCPRMATSSSSRRCFGRTTRKPAAQRISDATKMLFETSIVNLGATDVTHTESCCFLLCCTDAAASSAPRSTGWKIVFSAVTTASIFCTSTSECRSGPSRRCIPRLRHRGCHAGCRIQRQQRLCELPGQVSGSAAVVEVVEEAPTLRLLRLVNSCLLGRDGSSFQSAIQNDVGC